MFFLRSKSVELRVRDGKGGPMKVVGVKKFVSFDCLPENLLQTGDADLEVQEKVEHNQIDKSQNNNPTFKQKHGNQSQKKAAE